MERLNEEEIELNQIREKLDAELDLQQISVSEELIAKTLKQIELVSKSDNDDVIENALKEKNESEKVVSVGTRKIQNRKKSWRRTVSYVAGIAAAFAVIFLSLNAFRMDGAKKESTGGVSMEGVTTESTATKDFNAMFSQSDTSYVVNDVTFTTGNYGTKYGVSSEAGAIANAGKPSEPMAEAPAPQNQETAEAVTEGVNGVLFEQIVFDTPIQFVYSFGEEDGVIQMLFVCAAEGGYGYIYHWYNLDVATNRMTEISKEWWETLP